MNQARPGETIGVMYSYSKINDGIICTATAIRTLDHLRSRCDQLADAVRELGLRDAGRLADSVMKTRAYIHACHDVVATAARLRDIDSPEVRLTAAAALREAGNVYRLAHAACKAAGGRSLPAAIAEDMPAKVSLVEPLDLDKREPLL